MIEWVKGITPETAKINASEKYIFLNLLSAACILHFPFKYMTHFAKVCQNLQIKISSTFSNHVPVLLD